jgi:hypothetical protein
MYLYMKIMYLYMKTYVPLHEDHVPLHEDLCTFKTITGSIFLGMRIVADKIVEKIKTHVSCSIILFSENQAVYEIIWKNTVQSDRPQRTI